MKKTRALQISTKAELNIATPINPGIRYSGDTDMTILALEINGYTGVSIQPFFKLHAAGLVKVVVARLAIL